MSDSPPRPVPKRLADFEVIRRLGVGGMAEVFLAKKRGAEGTFKLLVVKRILPSHGSSRRFRTMFADEAQLATRLNHPNIVQVYDFQDYGADGQLLSMEYVEGPDLRQLQRSARARGTRIPPFVAAYVVGEVAKGLHYAHERKDEKGGPLEIVHRDVSPQNVLLSFDGAVKVADFGIASANIFREEPGVLKGKTGYMSPEQARADRVDRRSDIYSLGVVFHELLAGRPLHGGAEGDDLLELVQAGHVEPPSSFAHNVPPELEAVVMRALGRHPEQRFGTAREMAGAITRALFERQEIVDAHVLETVISELVARHETEVGDVPPSATAPESIGPEPVPLVSPDGDSWVGDVTGIVREAPEPDDGGRREVRHVAVVLLQLRGFEELESRLGRGGAGHVAEQLRAVFDELAFKHQSRWGWSTGSGGAAAVSALRVPVRAVVGLTADPARSALDAAALAVDVQEAVDGFSGDLPVPVRASIGLVRAIASGQRDEAGHLVAYELKEPGDYLAQLLGSATPAGAIYVAGGLYRLVRRDFVWGDAPSLETDDPIGRDLPRVMRVYELIRPLSREEKLAAAAAAGSEFVGRDVELAELQAAYHRALTASVEGGLGQLVVRVVFGEIGIGKSALISAFLRELPDVRVVRADGAPNRTELPFALVSAWIRDLASIRSDQALPAVQAQIRSSLGEFVASADGDELVLRLAELVVGQLPTANDEAEVAHHRRLLAAGLRRFVAQAALQGPVVLVVEGFHWADRPSLELIAELLRWSDRLPVLVLIVTRADERIAQYIEGFVRIELKGLSSQDQLALLQAHLGARRGVEEVCAELLPRAGGNPFFLLEMVDALLERGALELRELPDDTQELVAVERPGQEGAPLPSTLEQLIADRLRELPEGEHEVVAWLAIAGAPLDDELLDRLVGEDVSDAVVRLQARGLCERKDGELDFRHPLTRDVAYGQLPALERQARHRRLGGLLLKRPIARGLTAAIVARHLARGGATAEAVDLYLEAATAARASYQMPLATRYFRRVVSMLEPADLRRLDAHEALEEMSRTQGRWRERRRHLAALRTLARASQSPRWIATALLRTARYELDLGRLSSGLTSAQRAERIAQLAHSAVAEVQAQSLSAEMLRDLGDMQGALAACDRALDTAERSRVPARLRAEVLRTRGTLLRRVGRVDEAIEAHAEAIAVFRQVGARRQEARARNALAYAMYSVGRFEDAIALGLEAIRIDLAIGGRFQIAKTLSNIGLCFANLGDLNRGLAYLKRAREAHERYGDQDSRAETLLATAEVHLAAGEADVALSFVRDAGALVAVTGNTYDAVREKILRAVIARIHGDSGAAVMYAFEARQTAEAQAFVSYMFYAMAVEAAARVEVGEQHTGILLATTALGASETIGGTDYGLETRALCCAALRRAGSPRAADLSQRAAAFARTLAGSIRDEQLATMFLARPLVRELLAGAEVDVEAEALLPLARPLLPDVEALAVQPGPPPGIRGGLDYPRITSRSGSRPPSGAPSLDDAGASLTGALPRALERELAATPSEPLPPAEPLLPGPPLVAHVTNIQEASSGVVEMPDDADDDDDPDDDFPDDEAPTTRRGSRRS